MHGVTAGGTHPARSSTPTIGIGKALRTARLLRRKTIEEASRETRMRREHLVALETERFDVLSADVYVRGALRSYSGYVGLDPNRVLKVYTRHFGPPKPMLPPPPGIPTDNPAAEPHAVLFRSSPTWAFMIGVALLVLAVLATLGLLSW
ncbi:MAG TPA: helix-turn-helix transcriptional regulator [Actinomycetota bacterium]|nr:helix-turn-helix transcriptional regulator [Actinomycetota bacterium]